MSRGAWRVAVAYAAAPDRQDVIEVTVAPGTSVEQAIRASGMLERFPQVDLARAGVGIYGERVALHDLVRDGDRVEIYRPLQADPKEMRQRRARGRKKK